MNPLQYQCTDVSRRQCRRRRQRKSNARITKSNTSATMLSSAAVTAMLLLAPLPSTATASKSNLRSPNKQQQHHRNTASYPFLPSWTSETCTSTRPAESWETSHPSLEACCAGHFAWKTDACVAAGKLKLNSDNDGSSNSYPYLPDWGLGSCTNARPAKSWETGSSMLKICCEANFHNTVDDCVALGGGTLQDDAALFSSTTVAPPTNNLQFAPPAVIWWFPQWQSTSCTIDDDDTPAPEYMQNDPENQMSPTFKACCETHFKVSGEVQTCLDNSIVNAVPTRPPAVDNDMSTIPVDLSVYYYPKYTKNKCVVNGMTAPEYMQSDPIVYMSKSASECCEVQFPLNVEQCWKRSGVVVVNDSGSGGTNDGGTDTSNNDAMFNAARYQDHYYPNFQTMGCVNENDAPSYMKEDPGAFFFTTIELCCRSENYELDYQTCVENSVDSNGGESGENADDDMGQNSSQVETYVPQLVIGFSGRMYFQNVFIPSSNQANMVVVRDAIIRAVKSSLSRGYNVMKIEAKYFDGVNLIGIRRRRLSGESLEEESEFGFHPRELARMQMFSFDLTISTDCSRACAQDVSTSGREASFTIGEYFEDSIKDGTVYHALKSDMESQGLIGPFYSASLNDGNLMYESAVLDMLTYTFEPTPLESSKPSVEPSSSPTRSPSASPSDPPTKWKSSNPTNSPTSAPTPGFKFYPDYSLGTCKADGKHSEFEFNFFDSLEECCNFPWLVKENCLQLGGRYTKMPTMLPTSKPSMAPSRSPTKSPSSSPSQHPTRKQVSAPVTQAPVTGNSTPSPSREPVGGCTNLYHMDTEGNVDTCTNSLTYPSAWDNVQVVHMHLFATAQACCDAKFSTASDCHVVNVCEDDTTTENSSPTGTTSTAAPPSPTATCGNLGYHVNLEKDGSCTDDNNIVAEWLPQMYFTTGEACCDKFIPGECNIVKTCSSDAATTVSATPPPVSSPSGGTPACDAKFHISIINGAQGTCTSEFL
eukprot:scaffold13881_cov200-Alexandrium_tamarense.AAC.3